MIILTAEETTRTLLTCNFISSNISINDKETIEFKSYIDVFSGNKLLGLVDGNNESDITYVRFYKNEKMITLLYKPITQEKYKLFEEYLAHPSEYSYVTMNTKTLEYRPGIHFTDKSDMRCRSIIDNIDIFSQNHHMYFAQDIGNIFKATLHKVMKIYDPKYLSHKY